MKMRCACCGKMTVEEGFDICPVCGWEKDTVQERFIGFRGGANRLCLAEARESFRLYGYSDDTLPPKTDEI